MKLEEGKRLGNDDGYWEPKAREWRATHNQIGRAMKWTTKSIKGELENDNTIIFEFKMKMLMILQENKRIEYLKYKPTAIVKKFE